jgi:AmmeMemoRadiSam system protein B
MPERRNQQMSSRDEMPKLRNVDPVPVLVNGRQAIGLRDPLGLSDRMLCVGREALPVLALMDGRRSMLDIQALLTQQRGMLVFSDEIKEIVERLDDAYLLESDRFREAYRRKVVEYRERPFREASHAGMSYSADPEDLRSELDAFFTAESGPGLPAFASEERRPVGLIAPHIDIRSGGPCFAHGYHALASGRPSDVYVIFGTGHAGVPGVFTATNLDFDTPLGRVQTDREFLAALGESLGMDPAAEEILHAKEHVIEFQVIFLQHVLSGRHEFTIVPVLCSLSHLLFGDDDALKEPREVFEKFCRAMREACQSRSVCFIASADLDHVGPRYGDSFVPHPGTVRESLDKDREMMASLERLDVDGFIRQVAVDGDSKRICGFSPITAMLHCMDASEGRLLSLDHAQVDERNSFVSFASMIFY